MDRNSSTESVFHLSTAKVSATDSSSSSSLMMGSAPRTYLMVRPGYLRYEFNCPKNEKFKLNGILACCLIARRSFYDILQSYQKCCSLGILLMVQWFWIKDNLLWSQYNYLAGRSDLMKACTCGYAPSRHPHTSKMALGYLVDSSNFLPSAVQHSLQSFFNSPS